MDTEPDVLDPRGEYAAAFNRGHAAGRAAGLEAARRFYTANVEPVDVLVTSQRLITLAVVLLCLVTLRLLRRVETLEGAPS